MTYNYVKTTNPLLVFSLIFAIMFSGVSIGATNAFADDDLENDFIPITNNNMKNDPMIAKILENIEKSKKEFSIIQQKTNQEMLLDEQRIIVENRLAQELERMFKENQEFTPLAAFNKFIKKVSDDDTKTIFKGLFDYKENKVNDARNALDEVLKNGGTLQEAQKAYHDAAKIPRTDMIQLVKDLNIQVGFSDSEVQKHFDNNGKLPRYEDEQESKVSFVDLTTNTSKVNTSAKNTPKTSQNADQTSSDVSNTIENESIEENQDELTIKLLREEIRLLKEKINQLETTLNPTIKQVVFNMESNTQVANSSSNYFAEWLLDYVPGKQMNNTPIDPKRTSPINALNEPNSFNKTIRSVSLGIGGQIVVSFNEPVTDLLTIYEASWGNTTSENAIVEVSSDGKNWSPLFKTSYNSNTSNVHEFSYDLSDIGCVEYVRITDHSSVKGDGFDVDAVGATKLCTDST